MNISRFYMPPLALMGPGSLKDAVKEIVTIGFKKVLIVTDADLVKIKLVDRLTDLLDENKIECVIYDGVHPNPTVNDVNEGLQVLHENACDLIISFGGGSPHDAAKGIALLATNGGDIRDYEGLNKSAQPQFPLICVNTTAGTASEMTIFSIITDEERHVKMALVDQHFTPLMGVNDPELMAAMPKSLTAATGMDALTHAVEAYVSTAATPITDACALKAIELIANYLKRAVDDGNDMEARDMMSYAEFMAGMAFNNASLGYVHAMAHQLGGMYDLPHGVCNAILLPHVQAYNSTEANDRLKDIAKAMGQDDAIKAIQQLSESIGIPAGLEQLGVKEEDFTTLATNALNDACSATNPVQGSIDDVIGIYRQAM